jgi:hypothetical protein
MSCTGIGKTYVLVCCSCQVLLSRCGDALMLHLLLHASVFAPLPGGCLLQLSGLPAAEVGANYCAGWSCVR